jgi:hypothetical protein
MNIKKYKIAILFIVLSVAWSDVCNANHFATSHQKQIFNLQCKNE